MVAPDAISPLARYAALVAEVPVIRLAEPDARDLGLRDGQIVQALVQSQGDSLFFDLAGKRFDVPAGWPRVAPGDLRWFRFSRQGDTFTLRPLPPSSNPGLQPTPGGDALSRAGDSSMGGANSLSTIQTSARLVELLARPPGLSSLASILNPGLLESALIDAGAPQLARDLIAARLRSDALSADGIQRAVSRGGMLGEAFLASGQHAGQFDLKMFLRQVSRVLSNRSSAVADEVDDAVDDLERKQIESLQQSADGRLVFSVMLPFADAPPASLRFERHGRGSGYGEGGYTIDLHITPPQLGDLWMKTTVVGMRVDVTVWTRRPDIAVIVNGSGKDLEHDLQEAGLSLRAFNVLNGERPEFSGAVYSPRTGGLDIRA